VIPNLNGEGLLDRCLDALAESPLVDEVIVLDGGSSDASFDDAAGRRGVRAKALPGTSLITRLNLGVAEARNEYVLLLNNDAFVDPGVVSLLAGTLEERPGLALCGARLRFEDGSGQKSSGPCLSLSRALLSVVPFLRPLAIRGHSRGDGGLPSAVTEVTYMPLASVLVRRRAYDQVGRLDERFRFYYEDHDFCRRLRRAGWKLALHRGAGAIHVGGGTTQRRNPCAWYRRYHHSRVLYLQKHYPRGWRLYLLAWSPRALIHAFTWWLRALRARRRGETEEEGLAVEWAITFARTATNLRGLERGV
jgi:GT2 family glycosyltransferase